MPEVARGIQVTRAFEQAAAMSVVTAAAASSGWQSAGINANLDVDRAVRDAELLYESAAPSLIAMCRDRLFAATRDIASVLAAKTVLAELQIVRYHPGGRYV